MLLEVYSYITDLSTNTTVLYGQMIQTHFSFLQNLECNNKISLPVRIRVRIDPPHPLCVIKGDWMGWSFGWDSRCGTIKIPPCLKALSAEHRPKFCSFSSAMVTSPCKWKILERDVKPLIINQSINSYILIKLIILTRNLFIFTYNFLQTWQGK
jgi:hypothetical protein